jgi:hypothetical protein
MKLSADQIKENTARNCYEVALFRACWSGEINFKIARDGGAEFDANVEYIIADRKANVNTKVKFRITGGLPDGEVVIFATRGLTAKKYHLTIAPGFVDYKFDSTGALLICGNSEPDNSDYSVKIQPR